MKRPREPKCRICGCTQNRGCPAGCDWAEANLCTVCADFARLIEQYIENVWHVSETSIRRLYREVVYADGVPEIPKKAGRKK